MLSFVSAHMPALKRFEQPGTEQAFLTQYRESGLRFVQLALFLGAVLSFVFFALVLSVRDDEVPTNPRQLVRLILSIVAAGTAIFIMMRPGETVRRYVPIVGSCVFFASMAIGAMSLLPADLGEQRSGRWTVAMCLTCWLAYGFSRLPARIVAISCVIGSAAILASAHVYDDDYVRALAVYLLMANIIGWIMSIETERRERALFWSTLQLTETTKRLQQMAVKAYEADSAKTRVLAAVSHDLRQPLASLTLYAQLLRGSGSREQHPELARTVDGLDACIGALSSDLDRLSELGLRERGAPLPVKSIDLRPVLERIERVYSGQAIRCGVRLCVRLPKPGARMVASNESRLWDVFANLVGNALKFSAPERQAWVLVRVRRRRDAMEVVVRDNGIGIEPCDQRRVFDEYFQVSNPERSPKRGQGLGLSIVRETISRLPGHSVALHSTPGRGTRFTVQLPGAQASMTPEASAGLRPPGIAEAKRYRSRIELPAEQLAERVSDSREPRYRARAGKPYRSVPPWPALQVQADIDDRSGAEGFVLIVEDDESMRDALGRMFERWGIAIAVAASGEEAVEIASGSQRSFDAIVSDFRLPGAWDGLRLIEELRRLEGRRTPAILLSGEFRVEALRSDAPSDVHVMGKPPDVALLRELVIGYARDDDALAPGVRV